MNKKQVIKIKRIIGYDNSNPEHKRLLNRLKKEYQKLPSGKKVNLLEDLKRTFGIEQKNQGKR
jgi:hypothetical protein